MSLAAVYGPYNEDGPKEYNPKQQYILKLWLGLMETVGWEDGEGSFFSSGWNKERGGSRHHKQGKKGVSSSSS
jgi:hypothetical protein